MHYFKKNIGDYYKKAGRLTMLQHGAYTLLIDSCYDREKFPTLDEAIEWAWASTSEEIEAVTFVLKKFFVCIDGIYQQNRIKEEIELFYGFCEQQKEKGKKGGRPKGKINPTGLNKNPTGLNKNPMETQWKPNKTLTINPLTQQPINPLTINKNISANADIEAQPKKINGHRFIKPSLDEVAEYCKERGNKISPENFIDHYTANGWKVGGNPMKDWKASVRTWERNHYGKNTGKFVMTSEVINADF